MMQDVAAPPGPAERKTAGAAEKVRRRELDLKQLREIAQGFESIFVHMLVKSMRATVKKSEFLNGGRGEEVFTDMLDMHVSDLSARRGRGIGIAETIVKRYSSHVRAAAEAGNRFDSAPAEARG